MHIYSFPIKYHSLVDNRNEWLSVQRFRFTVKLWTNSSLENREMWSSLTDCLHLNVYIVDYRKTKKGANFIYRLPLLRATVQSGLAVDLRNRIHFLILIAGFNYLIVLQIIASFNKVCSFFFDTLNVFLLLVIYYQLLSGLIIISHHFLSIWSASFSPTLWGQPYKGFTNCNTSKWMTRSMQDELYHFFLKLVRNRKRNNRNEIVQMVYYIRISKAQINNNFIFTSLQITKYDYQAIRKNVAIRLRYPNL